MKRILVTAALAAASVLTFVAEALASYGTGGAH